MLDVKRPEVFEEIFHEYYASLCYFANKFVQDEDAAKDIVQEVFVHFWESKGRFENRVALKSFLYSCVQNGALNYLNKLRTRDKVGKQLELPVTDPDDIFCFEVEADVFEEIFVAIEELPDECRRVFKMSYIEFLDIKTICERLSVAESTVKTQRQRAKKYLKERLQHLRPLVEFIFF
ncbi:RNA polymerase sigma-70 factor [Butyricimonas muris]|nr:RNA polymerase sigma-70 factor [Butyricimonas synergistica]